MMVDTRLSARGIQLHSRRKIEEKLLLAKNRKCH